MTYGSRKQTFNQAFSARIASACKRLAAQRARLEDTRSMLETFLISNHPTQSVPGHFYPEMKELRISIEQLQIAEQALRDYNRNKESV